MHDYETYSEEDCRFCRGGIIHEGSSCYTCPDCEGTGIIKQCENCGKYFDPWEDFCTDCYTECDECGELVLIEECYKDEDGYYYCQQCQSNAIERYKQENGEKE